MPIMTRVWPVALALLLLTGPAWAAPEKAPTLRPMQAFTAQYRLKVDGWPGAGLTHKVRREGRHWKSAMRFSIAVASGRERSRFTAGEHATHSLHYYSGYSLFGIGDSYELADADIATLDRQTALIHLARRAGRERCSQSAPCDVGFVDHRGRDEAFHYYTDGTEQVTVPAGRFNALAVVLFDAEKPDRNIRINYHPDYPGLIVEAGYWKAGKRETHITLTQLQP